MTSENDLVSLWRVLLMYLFNGSNNRNRAKINGSRHEFLDLSICLIFKHVNWYPLLHAMESIQCYFNELVLKTNISQG